MHLLNLVGYATIKNQRKLEAKHPSFSCLLYSNKIIKGNHSKIWLTPGGQIPLLRLLREMRFLRENKLLYSTLIVGYHHSKIPLIFCNDFAIFCEGGQENANNGNDTEDNEVVVHQKTNLPLFLSLASAISTQAALDALVPLDTFAATASFGQIGLIKLISLVGLIGPIGLIDLIGQNGLIGFISLELVGLVRHVGHISLGHNGLIGIISLGLICLTASLASAALLAC
jgi:hypothetical protein